HRLPSSGESPSFTLLDPQVQRVMALPPADNRAMLAKCLAVVLGAPRAGRKQRAQEPTEQSDRLVLAAGRGAAPADFFLAIESDDAGAGAGAGDHGDGGDSTRARVAPPADKPHRPPLWRPPF